MTPLLHQILVALSMGLVGARVKHAYQRLTTVIAARNGVTETTYIAEALIPLIVFGLPLSPVAAGPAAPLFNAPPRFSVDPATSHINNLHTLMSGWEFIGFGLLSVFLAALIAYPFPPSSSYCDRRRQRGCEGRRMFSSRQCRVDEPA